MLRIDMRLVDDAIYTVIAASEQPLSQPQIAAIIGCSERTVNRSIKRLRASGHLEVVSNRGPYPYEYICTETESA